MKHSPVADNKLLDQGTDTYAALYGICTFTRFQKVYKPTLNPYFSPDQFKMTPSARSRENKSHALKMSWVLRGFLAWSGLPGFVQLD